MDDLNPMQELFCEQFIIHLNATKAAKLAGYAHASAHVQGSDLLKHPKVKERIDQLKRERSERLRIDADWLLARLAEEATADAGDLYDENGALRPISEWPEVWRQGLVAGITIREEMFDGVKVADIKQIKLADRTKILEMIGRHIAVGAFKDKIEVSGDADLVDRLARLRAREAEA